MRKDYIVFNMRLAGWLMQNGHPLIKLKKATTGDRRKNVFIFNESEYLLKAIEEYKSKLIK